jgi:recombinational DNA repair ATPase RecF
MKTDTLTNLVYSEFEFPLNDFGTFFRKSTIESENISRMKLSLYQFKHYTNQTLALSENLQIVVGNNGSGKSTLCEALSILVNASNPHHTSWEEKASFQSSKQWTVNSKENGNLPPDKGGKIEEWTMGGWVKWEWALRLELGEVLFQAIFDGQNRSPKWHMDESSCSKPKYEDKMPYRAFWIQSDHLRVISGEPSERRNFLDDMLTFASPGYEKILRNYRTALTSRNRVIQSILEREARKEDLSSWNTLLAEYAVQVIGERRRFFTWFNSPSSSGDWVQAKRREEDPGIQVNHLPWNGSYNVSEMDSTSRHSTSSWLGWNDGQQLWTFLHLPGPVRIELSERHPLEEITKEAFLKLLADYTERDLVVGRTTVGPHLDEISFLVNIIPPDKGEEWQIHSELRKGGNKWRGEGGLVHHWSPTKYILSRGENKILLLAFIRLLGKYVEENSWKKPFFLLDDVLSELDEDHTHILCQLFANTTTIMTTQPNHTAGLPTEIMMTKL